MIRSPCPQKVELHYQKWNRSTIIFLTTEQECADKQGKLKPLTRADAGDKQVNVSPTNTVIAASICGYGLNRPGDRSQPCKNDGTQTRKHGASLGLSSTAIVGRRCEAQGGRGLSTSRILGMMRRGRRFRGLDLLRRRGRRCSITSWQVSSLLSIFFSSLLSFNLGIWDFLSMATKGSLFFPCLGFFLFAPGITLHCDLCGEIY